MRRPGLLAILAVVIGYASVVQGGGWNQMAHFALVRALADGTAVVDPYRSETEDLSWFEGHYYSTKAPGLALLTVGPYAALDESGLLDFAARTAGVSRNEVALWALGLIASVLAAGLILLLVRRLGNDLEPGFGTVAAVTLGLGTLLFPFATLFFNHALSTALGFAAFALLWYRRGRLPAVAAAGLLAGFAVTAEYALALVGLGVGLYAIAYGDVVRRGLAYAAGVAVGVLPLFLYNWWAFDSPMHFPYENAIVRGGVTGHDVLGLNDGGLFGVSWPSFEVAMRLLFDGIGLVVVTPVVLAGVAGTILLHRRGRRREAILIGAIALAYLVYNSGYYLPFGGGTPGPRFLIPVLPFLALSFALAYRAWPWATLAVAAPSALVMLGVTSTGPSLAGDWGWVERIGDGGLTGRHGVAANLPLVALIVVAAVLALRATPLPRPTRRNAAVAVAALGGWVVVALAGPRLLSTSAVLPLVVCAAALLVVALASRRRRQDRLRNSTEPA